MTNEDLHFVADALVELCQSEYPAPFHTERQLERRIKRDAQRLPMHMLVMGRRIAELLYEHECREIFERAGLTHRQDRILRMRLEGTTFEEIGRVCGSSKQACQQVFVQALKKLTRSCHVYPYSGLSDVYRTETRRGIRGSFGTMHP